LQQGYKMSCPTIYNVTHFTPHSFFKHVASKTNYPEDAAAAAASAAALLASADIVLCCFISSSASPSDTSCPCACTF
jgi:hypothetical protein